MVGVGQDMTTLRRAMTEISSVADELRRIIEHANAPILGINMEGCVTEWNLKIAEISQYSKEEMIGKPLIETSSVQSTERKWAESCAWPSTASRRTTTSSRSSPRMGTGMRFFSTPQLDVVLMGRSRA